MTDPRKHSGKEWMQERENLARYVVLDARQRFGNADEELGL
jgi:hypothetical protein